MAARDRLFKGIIVATTLAVLATLALVLRPKKIRSMPRLPQQKYDFLVSEADWYVADPLVGFAHPPFARRSIEWPEHPRGGLELTTNNLGFRQDRDTQGTKAPGSTRYLIAGDSHIDGVVYNSETFPHQLETRLTQANPNRSFEVLNAATGMYGPHQYARTLEKHLRLGPDVFVVVVYTGNDFLDALAYGPESEIPRRPPAYFETLAKAAKLHTPAVDQALNQIYFFQTYPEMVSLALRRAYGELELIIERCKADGIQLLIVLLPTKLDLEWNDDAERLSRVAEALKLSERALKTNQELRRSLGEWLAQRNVRYVDASAGLAKGDKPAFWLKDYHLSVAGHRSVAALVFEALAPRQ